MYIKIKARIVTLNARKNQLFEEYDSTKDKIRNLLSEDDLHNSSKLLQKLEFINAELDHIDKEIKFLETLREDY